ncbi:hypothetical protein [Sphingomonas sp. PR090111-T3T-6A]|uniref:hypothetical protein n=1 Tax=Sphingomonas sp. PR090111-T3T-6A TaxID=685778 RepID=UPI00035E3B6F|nr:hypothetical protein [Sphingomonas sp. PR090111-T3T-6A]
MLRSFVLLVVGALLGAALFHLYYVGLSPEKRCGWDHPFDDRAKALCSEPAPAAAAAGYGRKARHDLDGLIDNVSN